jgi:hypothetical protein
VKGCEKTRIRRRLFIRFFASKQSAYQAQLNVFADFKGMGKLVAGETQWVYSKTARVRSAWIMMKTILISKERFRKLAAEPDCRTSDEAELNNHLKQQHRETDDKHPNKIALDQLKNHAIQI